MHKLQRFKSGCFLRTGCTVCCVLHEQRPHSHLAELGFFNCRPAISHHAQRCDAMLSMSCTKIYLALCFAERSSKKSKDDKKKKSKYALQRSFAVGSRLNGSPACRKSSKEASPAAPTAAPLGKEFDAGQLFERCAMRWPHRLAPPAHHVVAGMPRKLGGLLTGQPFSGW